MLEAAIVLAGTVWSSPAGAQELAVSLEWTAVSGNGKCIDKSEIVDKVEYTLGQPVFVQPEQSTFDISGSVGPGAGEQGWIVRIKAHGSPGREQNVRELTTDSPDCRQLDDAIALVIALLVDEAVSLGQALRIERELASTMPSPAPEPVPTSAPEPVLKTTAPQVQDDRWSGRVGPQAEGSYQALPGFGYGAGLRVEIEPPVVWPFALSSTGWFRVDERVQGSGGKFTAWTASLALCPGLLRRSRIMLSLCAGATGGVTHASGIGLDVAETHIRPYVQLDALLALRFELRRPLWIRLGVGAGVPLTRDEYTYEVIDEGDRLVHQANPVVPLASLGLELVIH